MAQNALPVGGVRLVSAIFLALGLWGAGDVRAETAPLDNCPFVPNPDQADADADHIGDACTCGDNSDNGVIDLVDVTRLVRVASGLGPPLPAPQKCGVGGSCDFVDVALLRAALVDPSVRLQQACDAASGDAAGPGVAVSPADAEEDVLRTEWIRLDLAADTPPGFSDTFELRCADTPQPFDAHVVSPRLFVVNPRPALPAESDCRLTYAGVGGTQPVHFRTAEAGAIATVIYDRTDPRSTTPFPDDFFLVPDGTTATGARVSIPLPAIPGTFEAMSLTGLLGDVNRLDGFSPIAPIVVTLSAAPDVSRLPLTPGDSLDPLATVGLFDLTPGSPTEGSRVPFQMRVRTDTPQGQPSDHTLIITSAIPLAGDRVYGLVVSNRARVDATRPFQASAFLGSALGEPRPGEPEAIARARGLAGEVIEAVELASVVPIPAEDAALAVRLSVRSTDAISRDLLAVRDTVFAQPRPPFVITNVIPGPLPGASGIGAVVVGGWLAPDFRNGVEFARDANGLPVQTGTNVVPFVLALPESAASASAPVLFYQHGTPGDATELVGVAGAVPSSAGTTLADEGFALIGFTDPLNREVLQGAPPALSLSLQFQAFVDAFVTNQSVPEFFAQANAEQIAFLRLIQNLGQLDVLPLSPTGEPAGDGVPDLDLGARLGYLGISNGAFLGAGLLPYAPEISAASLVVGGPRFIEAAIHQGGDGLVSAARSLFPNMTPGEVLYSLSLFQTGLDAQDTHNHARFLYRTPLDIDGRPERASVLVTEGLRDSLVPNAATRSLAAALLPLPHLGPVQEDTVVLDPVFGPVVANVDASTTAAYYQFVPSGLAIPPTPGCSRQPEGHFCPQVAPEAALQRSVFFQSALGGPPVIIDPLE